MEKRKWNERKIENHPLDQAESFSSKLDTDVNVKGASQLSEIVEPSATRNESNNAGVGNEIGVGTIVSNQNQSADILKLTIDCFEEAFDYLSLRDLISLSETCKQVKQVVGYILQQNYKTIIFFTLRYNLNILRSDYLAEFTSYIELESDRDFQNFLDFQPRLHRVKYITFRNFTFAKTKIERMKETLGKVENLKIDGGVFNGNFHDCVLAHCPNLKRLIIQIINVGTDWMNQKYPNLEHLEWWFPNPEGLTTFLELNSNIRQLTISGDCLWANQHSMMTAKVSLDVLEITYYEGGMEQNYISQIDYNNILFSILLELQRLGVYKRLQASFWDKPPQELVNVFGMLDVPLTLRLDFPLIDMTDGYNFSSLKNLERLFIGESLYIQEVEATASDLTSLECIGFAEASFFDILPFISQAANLKVISTQTLKFYFYRNEYYFDETNKIINLPALKKLREKLANAKKIRLYVDEDIYLATKWAYEKTDFGLIRMFRNSSRHWF